MANKNEESKKSKPATSETYTFTNFILLSLPMILTSVFMVYVLYNDYAGNRFSFFAKSRYYSNLPFIDLDLFTNVTCSSEYYDTTRKESDFSTIKQCLPTTCGRYASDFLVKPEEATTLLNVAKRAFQYGRSSGSASTFGLESGALSNDNTFIDVYKVAQAKHEAIYTQNEINLVYQIRERLMNKIKETFGVDNLYPTKPTFFSELTSKDAVIQNDEYWHDHYDMETYETFYYTAIVYLNSHSVDFFGGSFVYEDTHSTVSIEPKAGRVIIFTSGSENLHHVDKVQWGSRYALTIPFTCVKKQSIGEKFSRGA